MHVDIKCKLDFYHCPHCRISLDVLIDVLDAYDSVKVALNKSNYSFKGNFDVHLSCGADCTIEEDRKIATITSWKC